MNGREWIHALWLKPWILEARAQASLQYNRFLVLDSPVVPEDALGYSYFGRSLAALPGGAHRHPLPGVFRYGAGPLHPESGFARLMGMESKSDDRTLPPVPTPFLVAGVALLLAGLGIGGFIALEVYALYRRMEDNAFVNALSRRFADADLVVFGGEPLTVTAEGASILAIALFVVLALLGIHIAASFLRTGAHIVYPVFPYQLARIRQRMDSLQRRLAGR